MMRACLLFSAIALSFADKDGYGDQIACIPGYDDDCKGAPGTPVFVADEETPAPTVVPDEETPAPTVLPDEPTPEPTAVPDDSSSGPGPTLVPASVTQAKDCKLVIPQECVFPFTYKALTYTTCTGVDTLNGGLWCSSQKIYEGDWKQCVDPCKNKWPAKAIISSVVAGGVAVTGIGLIAAAVIPNANGDTLFNKLKSDASSVPAVPVAVVPVAVAPTVVAVAVPAPVPAARKFMETPGIASKLTTGDNNSALVLGGLGFAAIFLVLAVVYGIVGKKKSTRRLAPVALIEEDPEE